jgi:hypothetical protein
MRFACPWQMNAFQNGIHGHAFTVAAIDHLTNEVPVADM